MNRRATTVTLGNAPMLVLLVVAIIFFVAAGTVALSSFRSQSDMTGTNSRADSNSITALNSTAVYLSDYTAHGESALGCAAVSLFNASGIDHAAQFTVSGCYATLNNVTRNNTAYTVNYTLTEKTYLYSYNVSTNGLDGLKNFSIQIPTVGTMLGVGLILAVIIGGFLMLFARNRM